MTRKIVLRSEEEPLLEMLLLRTSMVPDWQGGASMPEKATSTFFEWNEAASYLLGCEVHFKDYGEIEKSLKPFSLEVK